MTTLLQRLGLKEQQNQRFVRPLTPAQSMRVPVTLENREYLRLVRQAELDAWRNAPGGTISARKP